ncbi:hypothetical protein ACET3Z_020498 [Daucus carota]
MGENKLLILYASQTGNAIDAAEILQREATRRCCRVTLLSIDQFDANNLPNEENIVFVVSTAGQGDPPDSMKTFWKILSCKDLGPDWLKGVHYAVFGLGDSGYKTYNYVAKKLDKKLSCCGAVAIVETGLGDDQQPLGYEGALDPWMSSLWKSLYQYDRNLLPKGPDFTGNASLIDQLKAQVTYHEIDDLHSEFPAITDMEYLKNQIERAHLMSTNSFFKQKARPHCILQVINNNPLCKDVHQLECEAVSSSGMYDVGDVLAVLPEQSPAAVDAFIKRCNLNPESYITIRLKNQKGHDAVKPPIRLKSFIEFTMDVASASPRRYFFEVMSFFASAQSEKEKLQYFISAEGRDALHNYQKEQKSVLQVLEDFPSVQVPFEWLIQLVPPLKTRAFSISSSRLAHPNQVHITVKVVSWRTPSSKKRVGLCSSWLAGLDPQHKVAIPVWFKKGSLPSPDRLVPLILIGPGTGCAPFRGFLEERKYLSSFGATAPVLFFFGCRNEDDDFLYKNFWFSLSESSGILSEDMGGGFYVAFSRDQREKVYVQHKMREQSARVWKLLHDDEATIYVAGSSIKMPSDVFSAFVDIMCKEGNMAKEVATRLLEQMQEAGKYNVESWS